MDQTTRAIAVLAAATLLVAPLVNGILAEAASTADRLFLREADWEGEPPDDLNGEPPEDPPPGEPPDQTDQEGPGPGGSPQCTIQEKLPPAAYWYHPDPANQTEQAVISRNPLNDEQRFEVSDEDMGMGILLNVTDLRGSLTARVYQEGQFDEPVWMYDVQNRLGDDVLTTSTVTRRGELTSGTWVAEIDFSRATYQTLEFGVVLATCAEAAS